MRSSKRKAASANSTDSTLPRANGTSTARPLSTTPCLTARVTKCTVEFSTTARAASSTDAFSFKPGAQKSEAHQKNDNLLLSKSAQADTKPQLEIFADDVKCTHGATVGQLDEDSVFYLRSRGIGDRAARSMLTRAFASAVTEGIRVAPLRCRIDQLLSSPPRGTARRR